MGVATFARSCWAKYSRSAAETVELEMEVEVEVQDVRPWARKGGHGEGPERPR